MTGFVRKKQKILCILYLHVINKEPKHDPLQIRRLIDSLMLKYADEVEVYRLQPVAQQFCGDMANAVTGRKPGRRRSLDEWAEIFFKRVRERGLRPPQGLAHLSSYLEHCLDLRILPQTSELLPGAARRGLIPRSIEKPVRF